jgi:hypothetical protein
LPLAAASRALARALAIAAAVSALGAPAATAVEPETANFDARPEQTDVPPGERAREALRDRLGRFGALSLDDQTGTLRSVGRLDGFLTGPSGRAPSAIALGYVRDHAQAFGIEADDLDGLRLVDRQYAGGIEHLRWEQRYRGIPVADAGLRAAVTGNGRLLTVTGPPASDLAAHSTVPGISAAVAYATARASGGDPSPDVPVAQRGGGAEQVTRFRDGGRASLTLYQSGNSHPLAWRLLAPVSSTGVYDVLVDARTGAVVRRANRVKFAVNADVFRSSPLAGPTTVPLDPWLTSSTTLEGPNAHAFLDVHDVVGPQAAGGFRLAPEAGSEVVPGRYSLATVPSKLGGDQCPDAAAALCTWDPAVGGSWATNKNQSATQLFYLVNVFHDHLRDDPDIAFVDGGFRANPGRAIGNPNVGADAGASDPVLAQALDGADTMGGLPDAAHTNNANFLTLPDGYPGFVQMYLWRPPNFGGYDGVNDASIVFHEYAHGLSGRLVTDAGGFEALSSAQAAALSEGWSDYYAMDYLVAQGLQPDGSGADVRVGRYLDGETTVREVRWQPIDCTPGSPPAQCADPPGGSYGSGGFTYDDFGEITNDADGVHDNGEIWAQTLWSLRGALGVAKTRRYVTEAMRLSPPEPSFLDMRNAVLQASVDEGDDAVIWHVFASHGMGYFASTTGGGDPSPVADDTDPADLSGSATVSGEVLDEEGTPVGDAAVEIAGLGDEARTLTDAAGQYTLDVLVPGTGDHTYPALRAHKAAYLDDTEPNVMLSNGATATIDFDLERDWSSAAGGASIERFTGKDNTNSGCGPGGLVDDDPGTVWGSENDGDGQEIVIDLGAPVDVSRIAIDPAAGCGDPVGAALAGYRVRGATGPAGPFTTLASGTFGAADNGRLNSAFAAVEPRVRYVAVDALTPQGGSGQRYLDVAEVHVARDPFSAVGPTVETGAPLGVGTAGATLTGAVVPHTGPAEVMFEFGTTPAYGATGAAATLSAGETSTPVSAAVAGLRPSTTYHYRIVARRGGEIYPGADASFTTGAPPTPTPIPTPSPTATPTPNPTPQPFVPTTFAVSRLSASRKGLFKVTLRFGSTAPAGTARLRVLLGKQRLAEGRLAVRPLRTSTKTLRLNAAGRKRIRAGKSRRVTLELRLPGGQKVNKTLTLARKRR